MAPVFALGGVLCAATFAQPFVAVTDVPVTLETASKASITVLDARDEDAFEDGHLPGAVHIDWADYRRGFFREGRLPRDPDGLARKLSKLGIDSDRPVLVCGAARNGWGEEGRIAWMLRFIGHNDVAILDGGCEAWKRAGRPWTKVEPKPTRGALRATVDARARAEKRDLLGADAAQILDVRTEAEYRGATPYYASRGGHIPKARHLYFKDLLDDEGRAKDTAGVREALRRAGINPDKPVVTYCTGGVRSAMATEVLRARGVDARNYDGSWWEWAADDDLPVEGAPK